MDNFKHQKGVEEFQCKIHEFSKNKDWVNIKRSFIRAPQIFKQKLNIGSKIEEDQEFALLHERFEKVCEEISTFQLEITKYCDMVQEFIKHTVAVGDALGRVFYNEGNDYQDGVIPKGYSELCIKFKEKWDSIGVKVNGNLENIILLVKGPLLKVLELVKNIKLYIKEREFSTLDINKYTNNVNILKDKIMRDGQLSLKQEQNLVRYEKNYELAKIKFDKFNGSLKDELPIFFNFVGELIMPLTVTMYLLQLTNHYHFLAMNEIPDLLFTLRSKELEATSGDFFHSIVEKYHKTHQKTKESLLGLVMIQSKEERAYFLHDSTRNEDEQPAEVDSDEPCSVRTARQVCTAAYDFKAQEYGDLSFKKGDKITVLDKKTSGEWWKGELNNKIGIFPSNYVKQLR